MESSVGGAVVRETGRRVAPRRHEIDALRVLATLLLIVFHTGMVFVPWTFHIQNRERSETIGWVNDFIHQWHMPVFFLLAGMAAWYGLRSRNAWQFAVERTKRLFVPLVVGMALIVPPQVFLERISTDLANRQSPINFEGNYLDFYPEAFDCCYPNANLSWHHLWFLMYLFVYSLVLVGLFKWLRGSGEPIRARLTGLLSRGWNVVLLPALYLGSVEFAMRETFPNNQDLVGDWANHANYLGVFFLGYLLVSDWRLEAAIGRTWLAALAIGVIVILLPDISSRFDDGTRGVAEWCVVVGLIGLGRRGFSREIGWVERFSAISLPFYIWHQTVIVVLAYFVIRWDAGIAIKFAAIAFPAFLMTWGLSEAVKHTKVTRMMFGLRP